MLANRIGAWLHIRKGEGPYLYYLGLLAVTFGLGMALGRSSSDALFFKRFGVQYLPQMFFITSIVLMLASVGYAEIVDRLRPGRVLQIMAVIMPLLLGGNWLFMHFADNAYAFAVYFLIYAVSSEILLVHFNYYAGSFFDPQQGKRLFPIINAATRLGAVLGGVCVGLLVKLMPAQHIALFWALSLLLVFAAVGMRHVRKPEGGAFLLKKAKRAAPFSAFRAGLHFARRSSLIKATGYGVFLLIVLISLQDYIVSTLLTQHFDEEADLVAFFGWFFAITNGLVLILQLVVTGRLLQRFGVRTVNLVFPGSTLLSFGLLAAFPGYVTAVIGRFNYTGMLPAFRNPAANLFYNAVPAYMQGRARATIVGLVIPLGMAISGLLLMLLPHEWVHNGYLALAGMALSGLLVALKLYKNRAYENSLLDLVRQQVFSERLDPVDQSAQLDAKTAATLADEIVNAEDIKTAVTYAEALQTYAPRFAGDLFTEIFDKVNHKVQDHLLRRLAGMNHPYWQSIACKLIEHEDKHLSSTAIELLSNSGYADAMDWARNMKPGHGPRFEALMAAILSRSLDKSERAQACQRLKAMLHSGQPNQNIAAVQTIAACGLHDLMPELKAGLQVEGLRVRAATVSAIIHLGRIGRNDCRWIFEQGFADKSYVVRAAAISALPLVNDVRQRINYLATALLDHSPEVRRATYAVAVDCVPDTAADYRELFVAHFDNATCQQLLARGCARKVAEAPAILDEMAMRHVQAGLSCKQLMWLLDKDDMHAVPKDSSTYQLTYWALEEETDIRIHAALVILAERPNSAALHGIIPSLRSTDRWLRAQGVEAMQGMVPAQLTRALMELLDGEGAPPSTGSSLQHVMQETGNTGSRWLQQCIATFKEEAS